MSKNILITGASKGIGYKTVEFFLKKGCKVVLVSRNETAMKNLSERYPGMAYVCPFDLKNYEKIEGIFEFCLKNDMKLDGMVHAAGVSYDIPVRLVGADEMKETFDVNYFASVQLGRFFSMKKYSSNGASAVYMSSLASFMAESAMSQYVASKCAVNALVKVLSKECVKRKLRINAIAPGFVDTEMAWNTKDVLEDFEENLINKQPLGIIPVEQIVRLIDFLLSDNSRFITGAIIPVGGGQGI